MGSNASSPERLNELIPYFTLSKKGFMCKLCNKREKNTSKKKIIEHFKEDGGEISCINKQRCPKCFVLIVKNEIDTHLKHSCKYSDVHFMQCDVCKKCPPFASPHDPTSLECMHEFLKNKLSTKGLNHKKIDLNDLYGKQECLKYPHNVPRSLFDICILETSEISNYKITDI